jgi:hypothetical protein
VKADEYDIRIEAMRNAEPTGSWEELRAEREAELADVDEGESDGEHVHGRI